MRSKNPATARQVNKFKSLARQIVLHHLGGKIGRVVHRSAGLTNMVFAVKHSDGDFIVRISPEPGRINSFIKEQWAQKAAGGVGVPVSEILEVGLDIIDYPYMISTTAAGVEATDHPKRMDILRELGRHAAAINSIKTAGFGATFDWSENILSRSSTFKEYLKTEYCYTDKLKTLEKHRVLTAAQAKRISSIFARAAKDSSGNAQLNHGDLRLKNVIVDADGKIEAIIDWQDCTSNAAPQWELSIALHDLGIDGMQSFLDGYGISEKKLVEVMPLTKAFNITNYTAAVERAAEKKDRDLLNIYRIRMNGLLDLYSL